MDIIFNHYFKVVPANTYELLEKVHNIRYEVFSKELGYFDEEAFTEHYEVDENDLVSQQCLIKLKSRNLYVGCVRLVSGILDGQRNQLPFESYYGDKSFSSDDVNIMDLDPSSYGEISRMAVISSFRSMRIDTNEILALHSKVKSIQHEDRNFPLIGFGLYLASAAMALNIGYERVFCMMEPRLARRLQIYGINFTQIAPIVENKDKPAAYKRAAYQITRKELLEGIPLEITALIEDIRNSLEFQTYSLYKSSLCGGTVEHYSKRNYNNESRV